MTEDQAKEKWCPFQRITSEGPSGDIYNNRGTAHHNPECIASACMAWRPLIDAEFKAKAEAAYRRDGARLTPDQGFCGLAGAPR